MPSPAHAATARVAAGSPPRFGCCISDKRTLPARGNSPLTTYDGRDPARRRAEEESSPCRAVTPFSTTATRSTVALLRTTATPATPPAARATRAMARRPHAQGTRPSTWQYPTEPSIEERMTIDSVVMRTAITLGLVIMTAALTWVFLPEDLRQHRVDRRRPGRRRARYLAELQARRFTAVDHALRRRPGLLPRRGIRGLRADVAGHRRVGRRRHGGCVRRHAGGVQVLQHPGHRPVAEVRDDRRSRLLRPDLRSTSSCLCSAPTSASTASARSG